MVYRCTTSGMAAASPAHTWHTTQLASRDTHCHTWCPLETMRPNTAV